MHELVSNLQVIAAALGAIATAWAVFHKSNREDYTSIIEELKNERDEYKHEYHAEHEQRKKLERKIEKLKEH